MREPKARPQSAAPLEHATRVAIKNQRTWNNTPMSSQRKGKLVQSLRRDKLVNALFLKLQFGGATVELQQLAKAAVSVYAHFRSLCAG